MRRYYTSVILLLSLAFTIASCGGSSTGPDNGGGGNESANYEVTTTIDPSGGGSVSPADTTVDDGETVSIQASPASDYVFTHWSGEVDSTAENPLSLTVDQDYSLTANFEIKTYELTINTEGEGSVSEKVLQQKTSEYETGTVVELTANPDEGYKFVEWKGDITGTENPAEITIDNPKEVTAVFEKKNYALTVNTNGEGAVSEQVIQQKSTDYEYGTVVELTANPSTGWKFVKWQDAATGTSNPTQVTVDTAKTVTAVFEKKKYSVNVTKTGDGAVSKSPDQAEYAYESTVDLTANPSTGWKFVEWTGDATGTNNPITITVNQDKSVEAVFEKKTYALTVSTQGEGSVTKSPDQSEYEYNIDVDLTANPSSGWEFVEWQGDVTGSNNPVQVTMDGPKDVTAVFKDKDALYVNDTGDGPDASPGDGTCATSGGNCTLRAAIQEANAISGTIAIRFDIDGSGPHTIQPNSALPTVTPDPIEFDGASEPDYNGSPVIEIDGSNAGSGVAGLTIQRSSIVTGLSIINFDEEGILLDGTFGTTIQNNYIGLTADGSAAGNGSSGITITNNSESNIIGNNVISENGGRGIFIGLSGNDNNIVTGNLIGTDPTGTSAMGNFFEGVLINAVSGTEIGGTIAAHRNVIAGNGSGGVHITGGASSTTVTGNYIGVAKDGETALGNGGNGPSSGIEVSSGATGTTIGGTAGGVGNLISGNTDHGVLLAGSSTANNIVQGNYIGTNAAGDAAVANKMSGIAIQEGANNNTIGGTASAARNIISGNTESGILIYDSGSQGTSNNVVQGNYIGADASGTADLGNGAFGVNVAFASQNTIGGSSSGAGNIIVGNGGNNNIGFAGVGIRVDGGNQTVIKGNRIGTDINGNPLGNDLAGVRIERASNLTIGGIASGTDNIIANNGGSGIVISSSTSTSLANSVRGNAIFSNSDIPIDLDGDGPTKNDAGDSDTGTNRLQNFPEIQGVSYDANANEVTVTYQVPSDPSLSGSGASVYDLNVDFYGSDPSGNANAYLGSDTYTATDYNNGDTYTATDYNNGPTKQVTFTPQSSFESGDYVVATSTDANGNTSELSATVN